MNATDLSQLLERFSRPGLPKYTALHDAVLHAVASGQVKPGTRMPNEQDLAQVLPLSLGTIQRALRQLVDERVIQRRPGQGSFISDRGGDGQMEHPFHCRFVDDSGQGYLPVFPEVLSREKVGGPGPCGPDSEIYWDWGPEHGCGDPACAPACPRCDAQGSTFGRS